MSTRAGPDGETRRLLLDEAPGERRGVVLLDELPERLLIDRDGEEQEAALGARLVGRVTARVGDRAFVALPSGPDGVLRLPNDASEQRASEGGVIEVEILAEAHAEKGPRLGWRGAAEGRPRTVAAPPDVETRLRVFAPQATIERGPVAREAADVAEEAALAVAHAFRGGLTLHVEPTRALAAVDVDLAAGEAAGPRRLREANLSAVRHAVRLLRLKALAGAAVIDLAGLPGPDDRGLLRAEAERALAPDGAEASALAPDRFGLLALARPRRERPVAAVLLGPDGRPSPRTVAQRLLRELERAAAGEPGSRWLAVAPAPVAEALAPLLPALGPRFTLRVLADARGEAHIRPA